MSRSPGYAVATQPGEELAVAAFRSSRLAGPTEAGSEELLGASLLRVPDLSAAVALARAGDEDAFRAVYRAVQPGLLRYLHGLVGPEASEVAVHTWAQIARGIASFDGDADRFRRWSATLARRRALDHLRRRGQTGPPAEDQPDH